jgi:lipopolysaccharide export LptBFGC system permease protein LptF
LGIFALFWKQKDLAQQVASQETKLPDPAKVLIKLRREREDLLTEIGVKNEELKDAAKDIEKFSTAAGLANKKADESVQRGKELAAKLQQLEARRKAAEEKLLATQAERDKKAQELKRLEEPAQIEPASPEKLVLVDRLKREIKGLEAEVEALKEEAMAHTTEVAELQRDIKTIAANTEAQRQLAVTCAKQGAEQREKSETITKEKNEMLATIEGIDRLREAATQQKLFHDVRCVINERLALAFSPLAFVLIAIPLGILCRHGHILVGFSIGMGLILIYYGLFTTGRVMAEGRYFYIVPSYWAADGLLSVVGVALLANIFKR